MPWLAIPYQDIRSAHLKRHFRVDSVPVLVVLDAQRRIVNRNVVPRIRADPEGHFFPYIPESAQNIEHGVISFDSDYYSCPAIFAFMENCPDADQDVAKRALRTYFEYQS